MTIGSGKYDTICTRLREDLDADAVVVVVVNGVKGTGFSVQATPIAMQVLPEAFENIAKEMRRDVEQLMGSGNA